jgi:phosphoglycolate phosphatase-like HAD superfamily hydrolase
MDIKDFDEIIIVGDRNEDKELAHNLNAKFINVKNKRYEELLEQAKNI